MNAAGEDLGERRVEMVELGGGGGVKVVTHETMALPVLDGPQPVAVTQYSSPCSTPTGWR